MSTDTRYTAGLGIAALAMLALTAALAHLLGREVAATVFVCCLFGTLALWHVLLLQASERVESLEEANEGLRRATSSLAEHRDRLLDEAMRASDSIAEAAGRQRPRGGSIATGRAHERADVLDFIRHPPGRVPERMRASLAELAAALERGDHVGGAERTYQDDEVLPFDWEWYGEDSCAARGPAYEGSNPLCVPDVRRFVDIIDGELEFQFEVDREPLEVVRAVIARHDRLAATGARQ